MKKFSTHLLLLFVASVFLFASANAQFPTIYATLGSGSWATLTTWETFTGNATGTPGPQGSGTPAASIPSGTHFVYIRGNHIITMGAAARSCYGMTIEATGRLWANESTARRLQLVNGGTGFLYPQAGTITNNGVLGGIGDGLFFETGTNCQVATVTGTGFTYIRRIRMPGGIGALTGGVVNLVIDQNMTVDTSNNYALTAAYNSAASDNYSITINAGKTLVVAGPSSYIHNNTATQGNYVYNIEGTLDLSASVQTASNLTALSPDGGTINFNINGGLRTGAAFNSSPVAPGVANINVGNLVVVDATLATVMNFNRNAFILSGVLAGLKRTVPNDGTKIVFPVTTAAGGYNAVTISGTTGPTEVFTVRMKNSFSNPAPANTISREWNILETSVGGNEDTVRLAWTTADEAGSGFSHAGAISIIRWNGVTWDYKSASVTGIGTIDDPYVAKGTGFTSFGLFGVSSSTPVPVSFVNVSVAQKSTGIQVNFGNAIELDVLNYVIERSADGRNFAPVTTLLARTNNGTLNSYTYTDANAVSGTNFYRIKATERSGQVKYSAVVKVNTNGTKQGVSVYPNPVKTGNLSVQMENLDKATYTLSLISNLGQTVYTKQISHPGGSATMVIDLPSSAKSGVYNLQISNGTFRALKNIIIE